MKNQSTYNITYVALRQNFVQINFQINVLPISIILADLEINLDENSGAKQHKLYHMCFSV